MSRMIRAYIVLIDAVNYRVGRLIMYFIFVLMGILLWSSISKTFFLPSLWTLEMAQFVMVGYYVLGVVLIRSNSVRTSGWICCMAAGPCDAKKRGLIC